MASMPKYIFFKEIICGTACRSLSSSSNKVILEEQRASTAVYLRKMSFWFDPDDEKNLEDMFDDLRGRLLQLDRKNIQTDQQIAEINRLDKEKSEARNEMEILKTANQKLQAELNAMNKIASNSERQVRDFKEENDRLKKENDMFRTENEKLAVAQNKMKEEYTELQRKHGNVLEKISIWHRIHEEVSQKQAQNQAAMLETAKEIGHAKASTLYIHQLKQQVEVLYKSAFETIKHLQDSRGKTRSEHPQGEASVGKVSSDESAGTSGMNDRGPSSWNTSELYWKGVNERLRTELLCYKEELWTGLQALSQLRDIKGAGPHSNSN